MLNEIECLTRRLVRSTGFGMLPRRRGRLAKVDRVVLSTILLVVTLFVWVPAQARQSLVFTLDSLLFVAPFLLLSIALAALISAMALDEQLARLFSARPAVVIPSAAVLGSLAPLCNMSVIPIVGTLMAAGVPLAPIMAFWIGSPLIDPEMFIMTSAIIGLPFALARLISAVTLGVIAGFVTYWVTRRGFFARPMKSEQLPLRAAVCASACGADPLANARPVYWAFWRQRGRMHLFWRTARWNGWFLLKWLTLAFVVESLLNAYVPADAVASTLGGHQWWTIPASTVVGMPIYLNGYAATPTIAALLQMGMAPGAALSFMVAGEVASIPQAMAVFVLVRWPVFVWYLLVGAVGALLAGFAYQGWMMF